MFKWSFHLNQVERPFILKSILTLQSSYQVGPTHFFKNEVSLLEWSPQSERFFCYTKVLI